MEATVYSVSQVNQYIKSLMDRDGFLGNICVGGEISNYKVYPSGHHYFTLKDADSSIRCVMFKGSALRLRFRPENGMKVLTTGRVSVFPRDGAYQLYCEFMMPEGAGDLHIAFEQLKQKLQAEGLFDPEFKKDIPEYPERIAIITSSAGAAIHDMLRILGKRYPICKVIVLPVRVQGVEAPPEICGAIRYVNRHRLADLIITGRGGGSIEDLWAFNDERVAYEIYRSEIPVISAVGHEPDVTISDYVADLRAATPSNAAELAVPDQVELRQKLQSAEVRLQQALNKNVQLARQRLERLKGSRVLRNPMNLLQDRRLLLDHSQKLLSAAMERHLAEKKQQLIGLAAGLDAMSPLRVLARGYSVTKTADGQLVTDAATVKVGDMVQIKLSAGRLLAEVRETEGVQNGGA